MAKLRAAERGSLRDGRKHCENQECTIERVHAPPQSALDQVDRGDSDGEWAEDQMELLEENELGQRMQIQILPECETRSGNGNDQTASMMRGMVTNETVAKSGRTPR